MFVAETLAMKAAGLDRDGIDVYFTVDGDAHNLKALVGDGGRQRLRKALLNAAPDNIDHKDSQTNMLEVLFRIAENWRTKGKSATTLLVLTDGLWKKTNNDVFDDAIIDLAQVDFLLGSSLGLRLVLATLIANEVFFVSLLPYTSV